MDLRTHGRKLARITTAILAGGGILSAAAVVALVATASDVEAHVNGYSLEEQ